MRVVTLENSDPMTEHCNQKLRRSQRLRAASAAASAKREKIESLAPATAK